MAYGLQKINPIDFKPDVAIGISLPFNGNAVFKSTYTTKDALKQNLINFFLTNPGERYMNPSFGGGLRGFIFEQLSNNNIDFLKEDITSKLKTYFPYIVITELTIVSGIDEHKVTINVAYAVPDTNIVDKLQLSFN